MKKLCANSPSGDPRIEFTGFINDREAARLYRDALAVLYAPYQEDYGLVTIEALGAGKPVLTTTDAGGPNEFVLDGANGFSAQPDPKALAERIDWFDTHPDETRAMAPACCETAAPITWERVVRRLLASGTSPARPRRKLTVAVTYPVYPPQGGGQTRIFHLYRKLAGSFDVDIVSFSDAGQRPLAQEIAPGLCEIRIPETQAHAGQEARLGQMMEGVPVTDVVMPELYTLSPLYAGALARSAAGSDLVVASHPYLLPALEAVRSGRPLVYEAHNVETLLKESILPRNNTGEYFVRLTETMERRCCEQSALILTGSQEDAAVLCKRFHARPEKIVQAPNGVDPDSVAWHSLPERRAHRRQHGDARFTVLFAGSWHGPNIEAAIFVAEIARQLPEIRFLVMGSAGQYFQRYIFCVPPNMELLGVVNDAVKEEILAWVDAAINPMENGSGTNLKMLEYMAAGIPVITTPFGARGLGLRDAVHVRMAPLTEFPGAIGHLRMESEERLAARVEAARLYTTACFSWDVIAGRVESALAALL